ncbi:MAG: hypothetical protein NC299_16110, partial [Lachnospiraceae bacterium]|nr:hypothetical protein [Lachnospiraceae bacterium]
VIVTFNFFPGMRLEITQSNSKECADKAHSSFVSNNLCKLLTFCLERTDVYEFEVGNRLYRRLRTDRPKPP